MTLKGSDFGEFFSDLYGYPAMDWQLKAASLACNGEWPGTFSLPTGAGKTSAIDIALFALAVQAKLPKEQRTAPMRTFLVVDRRTVVNEAFDRACKLRDAIEQATDGVLKQVKDELRSYGNSSSVVVAELRGGIHLDPSWCNSLTQPMIVTSTVDQVGSRLLFRGYGVSNSSRPMQAAVIAHDSLLILDEAHISKPFAQTLQYVRRYQQTPWANASIPLPMRIVEMTATPQNTDENPLEISNAELSDTTTHIGNIVSTPKRTKLEVAEKIKGKKAPDQLGKHLAETACGYVLGSGTDQSTGTHKVVGLMANTVATAKAAYQQLRTNKNVDPSNVHLVIGSMRPVDRDKQTRQLRTVISTGSDREVIEAPVFVVATQCIEVGADYDFDVLVTEAAPISSLVQRFGRLNRAGRRNIAAIGHIIMRGDRIKTDEELKSDDAAFRFADPIYGNAASYSWNWLDAQAEDNVIDFGITAFATLLRGVNENVRTNMEVNGDNDNAPVLLPAHLDLLCQTTIDPHPNPDVSVWLHGPQRNDPEVQICWRADLLETKLERKTVQVALPQWPRNEKGVTVDSERAIRAISLCPPSASECMSVRLVRLKTLLQSMVNGTEVERNSSGDVAAIVDGDDDDGQRIPSMYCPVAWRGPEKSQVITRLGQIRPGDTLVFSIFAEGWNELGFIPEIDEQPIRDGNGNQLRTQLLRSAPGRQVNCIREDFERFRDIDVGANAFQTSRDRLIARIHRAISSSGQVQELKIIAEDCEGSGKRISSAEVRRLFKQSLDDAETANANAPAGRLKYECYEEDNPARGIVIYGPVNEKKVALPDDDGSDVYSSVERHAPVPLTIHSAHVKSEVESALTRIAVRYPETFKTAALCHDWGKADVRFQAMLLRTDTLGAYLAEDVYARSDDAGQNRSARKRIRERAELPFKFRHELLSTSLIEKAALNDSVEDFELLLHVVASHHGYARPWCLRCDDTDPDDVSLERLGHSDVSLTKEERKAVEYHAIDSPVVSRFLSLNNKYGWWGLAFLESILRFADRRASQVESELQSQDIQIAKV